MVSFLIGGVIIVVGLYLFITSIKKEATDGCYACPSKKSCSKTSCSPLLENQYEENKHKENKKENPE